MSNAPGRTFFFKAFVVLAASLLLGIGLCGLDYLLASRGIGKSTQEFGVGPLDSISLLAMGLSALGLFLTAVAWLLYQIVRAIAARKDDKETTRLFDKDDQ
jgi:hypothetical protein